MVPVLQVAEKFGSQQIARPWSRYSEGSAPVDAVSCCFYSSSQHLLLELAGQHTWSLMLVCMCVGSSAHKKLEAKQNPVIQDGSEASKKSKKPVHEEEGESMTLVCIIDSSALPVPVTVPNVYQMSRLAVISHVRTLLS